MVNVTARKIREHGRDAREKPSACAGLYHGLWSAIRRWVGMVIFRDPNGHRMVTTPVRRVLTDPDSDSVYVETENSVYRLTFHAAIPLCCGLLSLVFFPRL